MTNSLTADTAPAGPQGAAARPPGRRACARRPWSTWPRETGYDGLPDHRRRGAVALVRTRPPTPARWSATWRPSPTPWASCRPPTRWPGSPPSAPRTWPPTGSSTPRSATPPSCTSTAGWTCPRWSRPSTTGSARGSAARRPPATPIRVGALLTAMRHAARSMEIAELAVRYRDDGVVGLRHRRRRGGPPADPAPGRLRVPPAGERPLHDPRRRGLRAAVDLAGHPVVRRRPARPRRADHRRHRRVGPDGEAHRLGRLAAYVRDKRIPLEMCPTSNVMTGAAKSIAEHPIGLLRRLHFRVTVNTDNRLMSGTSMTREFAQLPGGVRLRPATTSSGSRSTR